MMRSGLLPVALAGAIAAAATGRVVAVYMPDAVAASERSSEADAMEERVAALRERLRGLEDRTDVVRTELTAIERANEGARIRVREQQRRIRELQAEVESLQT